MGIEDDERVVYIGFDPKLRNLYITTRSGDLVMAALGAQRRSSVEPSPYDPSQQILRLSSIDESLPTAQALADMLKRWLV